MKKELQAMRHSAEHVLHQAMEKLYPGLLAAMGPATAEGFYFDFDPRGQKISETDFPKIEAEMRQIIKADLPIVRREISFSEAQKLFKHNPYKLEWLNNIKKKGEKAIVYATGKDFIDLCAGPHVTSTGKIGPFKLLSIAGAYWHGDEKKPMLTRIYGTCFATQKELKHYLWQQEEAKKRDHRLLGQKLELFFISNAVGQGLPIILPKGATIIRIIQQYNRQLQESLGYQEIMTPHVGLKSLWQTSGHWQLYRELMYEPMKIENKDYLLKPMNCPFHILAYKHKTRSYKELPLKFAEYASVYRLEKSGELNGLLRVRGLMQDDAHIFCEEKDLKSVIWEVIDLCQTHYRHLGIKDYQMRLSLRDPQKKKKYLGDDQLWLLAEQALEKALKEKKINYYLAAGEAAFYGPKIDPIVKDSLGREWQIGTVQLDFMLPERFQLGYIDQSGKEKKPVLVHRAPLGSFERLLGILTEYYGGAFPLWLAPIQVRIIPIAERHLTFAKSLKTKLTNLRVDIDERNETMQKKIKEAEEQKIPYMLIIGDREVSQQKLAVRQRGEKNLGEMSVNQFFRRLKLEIEEKLVI